MSVRKLVWLAIACGWLALGGGRITAQEIAKIDAQISSWSREQWPFSIDQWGTGQAFRCAADRCGREVHLYLRAKIGFCRCATGVSDDDEIERVGDIELIGANYQPLAPGHPVMAGIMTGRARLFSVARPLQSALPLLSIAMAHKCDAIVATMVGEPDEQSEAQALDLLRSAAVQHWVESQAGAE